jgi:hypothetical protein
MKNFYLQHHFIRKPKHAINLKKVIHKLRHNYQNLTDFNEAAGNEKTHYNSAL